MSENNNLQNTYDPGSFAFQSQFLPPVPPPYETTKAMQVVNITLFGMCVFIALISVFGVVLYVLGKIKKNSELIAKAKYRISLGLPALLFYLMTVAAKFVDMKFVFILGLASLVAGFVIFIIGYKTYRKYKLTDPIMKKQGKRQLLFMIWFFSILAVLAVQLLSALAPAEPIITHSF